MKRLLILRHAQALNTAPGGTDKTRKLSPKGIEDAKALGVLMAREALQPDAVLCSTAVRTRETLEAVMESLNDVPIDYMDSLYNAPDSHLLQAIQEIDDKADSVLLVAHNPAVHMLASRLAADDGAGYVDRLMSGYAPATLTVLSCDIDDWDALKSHGNAVKAVHETIDYNADQRPTRWM